MELATHDPCKFDVILRSIHKCFMRSDLLPAFQLAIFVIQAKSTTRTPFIST